MGTLLEDKQHGSNTLSTSHSSARRVSLRRFGARLAGLLVALLVVPSPGRGQEQTYTSDADFDRGTAIGVHHDIADQLQLETWNEEHAVIWIVKTGRKSILRLDAVTGEILGEYRTAPDGRAGNPSRTAVDAAGNVWVANGSEAAGGRGSVLKVGLVLGGTRGHKGADGSFTPDPSGSYLAPPFLYSTAVDRDGDGLIRTSRGLADLLAWPDQGDGEGGDTAEVHDAEDECLLLYQRTTVPNVQHVSVAPDGRVWVGGFPSEPAGFDVLHPESGRILESDLLGCGGYGGTVDAGGVLWSASFNDGTVLRHDVGSAVTGCTSLPSAAGLAVDAQGFVWCTLWDRNAIAKLTPQGELLPGFPKQTEGRNPFGVAIGHDADVWVANRSTNDVTRFDAAGNLKGRIAAGAAPMGIDVDAHGKVWVVNRFTHDVLRIDPQAGDGGVGAVDLRVELGSGASPIAYGGMTGLVRVRRVLPAGSWRVVHDGGRDGILWERVTWNGLQPGSSRLTVFLRSAAAPEALAGEAWQEVQNGGELPAVQGRFLEVRVDFLADAREPLSPVLLDLHLLPQAEARTESDCSIAAVSREVLWPPDGRMVPVEIVGVTDGAGNPLTARIVQVLQDEPVGSAHGMGSSRPVGFADARGVGESVVWLRAARQGGGNGRVYTLVFAAGGTDAGGCEGSVTVCVPHDQGDARNCIDDGTRFDSTQWSATLRAENFPNPFNPSTTIVYNLTAPGVVHLAIYDALGRHVRTLVTGSKPAGSHSIPWSGIDAAGRTVPSGVYYCRLRSGEQEAKHRMLLLK